MWLFTTHGFYSAVTYPEAPESVVVRAGARDDVRRRIATTASASASRVTRGPHTVVAAAKAIDYPNFKAAIAERQGADRAHVYGAVWAAMFAFQQRRALDRS